MGVRILIADDYPLALKKLKSRLEENPTYQICAEAINGPDVVRKARALHPDLIILDLALPDLSGFEAARQILNDCPETPIFLYTLCGVHGLEEQARLFGIRGVFVKGEEAKLICAIERLRPSIQRPAA
jgi:DNA-binding NarL/FixJ family response regulator